MKVTEKRTITASALRELCIANDWYTCGDNDEYSHLLLEMAQYKDNLGIYDIMLIAEDIIAHSDNITETTIDIMNKIINITETIIMPEEEKTSKTLCVTIQCMAVYNSCIEVPVNMSLDEAIEYARENLGNIPLGVLEYVSDSDELDEENCNFLEE